MRRNFDSFVLLPFTAAHRERWRGRRRRLQRRRRRRRRRGDGGSDEDDADGNSSTREREQVHPPTHPLLRASLVQVCVRQRLSHARACMLQLSPSPPSALSLGLVHAGETRRPVPKESFLRRLRVLYGLHCAYVVALHLMYCMLQPHHGFRRRGHIKHCVESRRL